jgi:hypothetical protein
MYCCEAESEAGFVYHLAVNYVSRGYFFYAKGEIPWDKDPAKTDAKIIRQYGLGVSKWTRCRQRQRGEAGVQYLRHKHQFVIIATAGEHRFLEEEANVIQDIRRMPLKVARYSIAFRDGQPKGHVSVRIEKREFLQIKSHILGKCLRASVEDLIGEICSFTFLPFAPIRRQLFVLLCTINKARTTAGLERIPSAIILRQRLPRGVHLNRQFQEKGERFAGLQSDIFARG